MKQAQKFNVGDTVKIVKSGYGTAPEDIGKTTTIVGIKRTGYSIGYVYDTTGLHIDTMPWITNHRYNATGDEAFEKVQPQPKEQKMEFKVGQKVRVTSSAGNNFSVGDIVTVERKAFTTGSMILRGVITNRRDSRYGTVDTQSLSASQFEAINEIQVGDMVRIKQGGFGIARENEGIVAHVIGTSNKYGDPRFVLDTKDFRTMRGYNDTNAKHLEFVSRLDLTKPVFTIEGTPVTIVTTQGRDEKFPVLAYEGKATQLTKFSLLGEYKHGPARRNLTNEAPKPYVPVAKTVSVALYKDGSVHVSPDTPPLHPLSMNGAKRVDVKTVSLKETA